jgi:hypothetical protein
MVGMLKKVKEFTPLLKDYLPITSEGLAIL